jgi:hypothetical protein
MPRVKKLGGFQSINALISLLLPSIPSLGGNRVRSQMMHEVHYVTDDPAQSYGKTEK